MTKKENEILSRRSFFKKAAGIVIPAVAMVALPSVMTSCEIDEEYSEIPGGCSGCSGKCTGSCSGGCYQGCSGQVGMGDCQRTCVGGCSTSCKSTCKTGCKGTCRKASRY